MLINLASSIEHFKSDKKYYNNAATYLPIGPNTIAKQGLDWKWVTKHVYEYLLGLECPLKECDELYDTILNKIDSDRETKTLKNLVREVYLDKETLSSFSPYLHLIHNRPPESRSATMGSVFGAMLSSFKPLDIDFPGVNFVEKIINDSIKKQCNSVQKKQSQHTYLPFLADCFQQDLDTLSRKTDWLAEEFEHFLEIYGFLYLSQLSLHLGITNKRFQKPKSTELYFVLETESTSKERHECNIKGFNYLFSKNAGLALDLFPHLGYLELLSDKPIWQITDENPEYPSIQEINQLNKLLCEKFELLYEGDQSALDTAINSGLYYHSQLFKKTSKTSARYSANQKVFTVFKDVFAQNFQSNRKAGGMYLQLSTRSVILVTNLIIGENQKLLIDDIIEGFKKRGIYFDLKSRFALLKVYKNIGNIEKLSDSGDAVYVKRTI